MKGPWDVIAAPDHEPETIIDPSGFEIASVNPFASSHGNGEHRANAALIAEAGTVYHETGLTPREILAQRDELFAALDKAIHILAPYDVELESVDEVAKLCDLMISIKPEWKDSTTPEPQP